ncbi:hypothetical protein F5888DRAFT_1720892, partial [Russula emetica]
PRDGIVVRAGGPRFYRVVFHVLAMTAIHNRVLLTNRLTRYYLAQPRTSINLRDTFQQCYYHITSFSINLLKDSTAEMLLAHPIPIPILLPAYILPSLFSSCKLAFPPPARVPDGGSNYHAAWSRRARIEDVYEYAMAILRVGGLALVDAVTVWFAANA